MDEPPLLQVRQVSKSFPGVRALSGVDLTLNRGEVLALIGENGAGKSTLMKILAGVQRPDAGQILVDGQAASFQGVRDALGCGIALIHQELNLADNLQVGANIFLGREPRRFGWIDVRRLNHDAQDALDRVGLRVSPRTMVHHLSIGQQQLVEIAKALSVNARILIMDEPTSSLTARDVEQLFAVIRDLRSRGVSIIYISHRLGEVRELADRVAVLRDGRNAGELRREQIDHDTMVRMMVGRDISQFYARQAHAIGPTCLEVEGLVTSAWPGHSLSFQVRQGEIVGVAGLIGAGRTEMLRAVFGIDRPLAGVVRVNGQPLRRNDPRAAIRAGVALVPEDRKRHGVVVDMSVRCNLGLAGLRRHAGPLGWYNRPAELRDSRTMVDQLRIKTPGDQQIVRLLSGGNQQKVVLGKWLALEPSLLLLDEPTRGIDVGAKQEVYSLMEQLAARGMAILFVSSELEEILGMSDRVLVMREGQLAGELARGELSEQAVMDLAVGRARRCG